MPGRGFFPLHSQPLPQAIPPGWRWGRTDAFDDLLKLTPGYALCWMDLDQQAALVAIPLKHIFPCPDARLVLRTFRRYENVLGSFNGGSDPTGPVISRRAVDNGADLLQGHAPFYA